jgi:hypothetical protein
MTVLADRFGKLLKVWIVTSLFELANLFGVGANATRR